MKVRSGKSEVRSQISLKKQLEFCERNVHFQQECINSFKDKDFDDELFEVNALVEDLTIMEAIWETIRVAYFEEENYKKQTRRLNKNE